MRIHSSIITPNDVHHAIRDLPGVSADTSRHGSRSHGQAVNVLLEGTSKRRNMGNTGQAATWDEWGVMMARLFEIDPDALMGKESYSEFEERTGYRFEDGAMPADAHGNHRWIYSGTPRQFECATPDCSATLNN